MPETVIDDKVTTPSTSDGQQTQQQETPKPVIRFEDWSPEERNEFRRTHKYPASVKEKIAGKQAPGSSAKSTEQASESGAVTEKADKGKESGAKPPKSTQPGQANHKKDRESRINSLTQERDTLKKQVAELEELIRPPSFEPPKFTKARPTKDDKAADGTWKFLDEQGQIKTKDYEDALADWGAEKARFEESQKRENQALATRIKETAAAHNISQKTIFDTAEKFLQSKEMQPLVSFVGSSPEFTEMLYVLSEGTTFDQIISTAKTDPRTALRALFVIEEGIIKARNRAVNEPEPGTQNSEEISEEDKESDDKQQNEGKSRLSAKEKEEKQDESSLPPPPRRIQGSYHPNTERLLGTLSKQNDYRSFKNELNRQRRSASRY